MHRDVTSFIASACLHVPGVVIVDNIIVASLCLSIRVPSKVPMRQLLGYGSIATELKNVNARREEEIQVLDHVRQCGTFPIKY